jgi:prophage regulatory protein
MNTCIEPNCLPPSTTTLPSTGFIRLSVVLDLIPWSKSTLWNRVAAGQFPRPVPLGPRLVGWRVEAVLAYIQSPAGWEASNA